MEEEGIGVGVGGMKGVKGRSGREGGGILWLFICAEGGGLDLMCAWVWKTLYSYLFYLFFITFCIYFF